MNAVNGRHVAEPSKAVDADDPEIAAVEADIQRSRDELAHTVDQLAAKLDVKTRAREGALDAKDRAVGQLRALRTRATDGEGRPTPVAMAVGGVLLAGVTIVVMTTVWRRTSGHDRKRR